MKPESVISLLFILFLTGCSKKEAPNSNQEALIGEWEWVESFFEEYDFHNNIKKYDTIPPHKTFRMIYSPKGKVTIFQDEIPKGQKYNSYIMSWNSSVGYTVDGKTIFEPGIGFFLVLNRLLVLNKGKDFEQKVIQGVLSNDSIFIFSEKSPYFDIPHPNPQYVNYEIIAILKKVNG